MEASEKRLKNFFSLFSNLQNPQKTSKTYGQWNSLLLALMIYTLLLEVLNFYSMSLNSSYTTHRASNIYTKLSGPWKKIKIGFLATIHKFGKCFFLANRHILKETHRKYSEKTNSKLCNSEYRIFLLRKIWLGCILFTTYSFFDFTGTYLQIHSF